VTQYMLIKNNQVVAYEFSLEGIKKQAYKRLKGARGGTVFFIAKTIGDMHKTLKSPVVKVPDATKKQRIVFNKY